MNQDANPYEPPVERISEAPQIDTSGSSAPAAAAGKPPIPGWAWIFVGACVLIPVVSLGGGIPAGLAAGGASACVSVARNPERSVESRVALCCGITLLCWALFAGLIVAVVAMQAGR